MFFFHVCLSVNNDSFQHSLLITQPHRWGVFEANGFVPQKLCEVDKLRTAMHMVENGHGNAFLPRSLLAASESCLPAFPMTPSCDIFLVAAYLNKKEISRQAKDLLELMIDKFK